MIITDHHLPGTRVAGGRRNRQSESARLRIRQPQPRRRRRDLLRADAGARANCANAAGSNSIGIEPPNMADYLDLVALGTVADVVPLDRNNRILVQQGLRRIQAGKARPGIRALCEASGRAMATLSAADLAFALGPRLNAAGRLDDMSIGIRCLLADNLIEARSLATALEELNESRRMIQQQMTQEAELAVVDVDLRGEQRLGLCVYREGWHQGVVGIVAGKLKDRFGRPTIAFADAGATAPDELRGSARSISGVHIRDALDAIATRYPGLIQRFGGHAMAAGLSIRRVHLARFSDAFATEIGRWVTRGRNRRRGSERRRIVGGRTGPVACRRNRARWSVGAGFSGTDVPRRLRHRAPTRRRRAASETVAAHRQTCRRCHRVQPGAAARYAAARASRIDCRATIFAIA